MHPNLGKAGTPYARSVTPQTMQPGVRPDPEVIFDSLMSRKVREDHPNKISSVLFYLASIIIHDLFRTDREDFRVSNTSSYLDLSPLYGSFWEEQKSMRTFKDGKIKPDCFAEKRLLAFPPGVGVLLIMFNRFHNYIVDQLALINEGGQFTKPKEGATGKRAKTWEQYDEDLFQTGRLITCGLYVNIILADYVRTILNLNQTNSNWKLDPRADIKDLEKGKGNQVSAEFNLVYRWHSTISERDEKWTEDFFQELFEGKKPDDVSWHDFVVRLSELDKQISEDPSERPFARLERQEDGTFDDDDLVKIITEGIEDCANSYGAQRVPAVMKAVEVLGIQQARVWNVASLNEFRKYFGLTPHETFEDINSDPHVADQLKRLYDHPDYVELYPGLIAEEAKIPMVPGAGLTPSFTISRAVLSDAVALVRGDRFYTVDYHPKKLTNWGFHEVQGDNTIDNGCVFFKLFLRAFPKHFKQNSVYAHYPMTVPSKMKDVLTVLETAHLYDFERPKKTNDPSMVFSYAAASKVLNDQQTFKVTWGPAIEFLMGPAAKDFMLSGDGPKNAESRKMMHKSLYVQEWEKQVKEYYLDITKKLIKEKSYKLAGVNQVDIIRDVGNLAHVHFGSDLWSLPLKTKERPLGVFTESEMYLIMAGVFICVFFDLDPANSFPLRQKAYKATHALGQLVEANVTEVKLGGIFNQLFSAIFPKPSPLTDYGLQLTKRLLESGMDVKKLVWGHILGTAGGMIPNQGQLFGQILEFYLTVPEGQKHLPEIRKLALQDSDEAFDKLMHYVLEGARLYGETGVFRAVATPTTVQDGNHEVHLKPGDVVMVNLRAASHDAAAFPNPKKVDLTRPIDKYIFLGQGPHECLGLAMTRISLTSMLKVVGALPNLRPAKGPQGKVQKVKKIVKGHEDLPEEWSYHAYLTENWDSFFPFPCSLKANWDDE
ncbi:heme peroxidase [Eremomyces bilateralis CBS 781.70]|uniref:Heme peroxidase n=1 Tax=Eremomyces bilateralis CBS 781.70 TaxID=1392243 RepID=A0A6G1FZI7_9PEZI|nr:heme peroxidase [Eremomyces bilateralis CBS 781.70]KAF1811213.1 heme peroxidase [Eremomyces bilateralis CBS 781.70]